MEGTVRNLLDQLEPAGWRKGAPVETLALQDKERDVFILKEQKRKKNLEDLEAEVFEAPESEGKGDSGENEKSTLLLSRLKALEAENLALALENENQREQYERCLDEVANQVVQALLCQKDLRKKCVKLKARVLDLEEQNRALSVLLQQRIRPACDLLLQDDGVKLGFGVEVTGPRLRQSLFRLKPGTELGRFPLNIQELCPADSAPFPFDPRLTTWSYKQMEVNGFALSW
ncbi:nck-associated protein 5 [Tachyglossus aculeatus]|uniref:nck-associated protein 5 n=1 Tax=Tachyglossus aculeatus TaxID=9261 RepID=UPI0018F60C94|nr:nck-associated protein 5 [Tachyglossus aculeatus]